MGLIGSCQSKLSAADSPRAATEAVRRLLDPELWSCTGCLAVERPLQLLLYLQPQGDRSSLPRSDAAWLQRWQP